MPIIGADPRCMRPDLPEAHSMRISLLCLVLFVFVLRLEASAQGLDLRGVVIDSTTGERLPLVTVSITGTKKGAVTNAQGFYLIPAVPYGRLEVVARAIGYERSVRRLNVQEIETLTLNFQLTPRAIEITEVVVEGVKRQLPTEISTGSYYIDRRELQLVPSAGQDDVFRSMQILPGIVTTSDVSSRFYVRGGAGDQNLIIFDGMKIYNPFHAYGIYSIFDPDIVRTTEVFTGAFPASYGGRLSSVVNMTARSGNRSRVAGKAGVNLISSKLLLEGPLGENNSWIVLGRRSIANEPFRRFLNTSFPASFYDFFIKATLGISTIGRQSFQVVGSGDDIRSPQADEPDHAWRNQAWALSISGLISDRVFVDVHAFTNVFRATRDPKASPTILAAESKIEDPGIRAEMTIYTESRDLFRGGFEFGIPMIENRFSRPEGQETILSTSTAEFWLWLRHQGSFGLLRTDIGFHSDVASLANREVDIIGFQPRITIAYQLSELWRVKAGFGVYSQNIVTFTNEEDLIPLFEAWFYIPGSLKPEQANHYVLGIEGSLVPELSFNVEGYYKDYASLVVFNRDKIIPSQPDFINATGEAYGGEALLRYSLVPVDLFLAYSLAWTSVSASTGVYTPRYDRRHTVKALVIAHPWSNLDFSMRWDLGTGYPFTPITGYYDELTFGSVSGDPFFGNGGNIQPILGSRNSVRLPVYHRLDASVNYRFEISSLRGSVGMHLINLYGRRNILYYDQSTGKRVNMVPFYPSLQLTVEY
jgi:CarboxypepD_reg-like domain/TonB dependent receptor-like, beta-barrel/TonB-dependent Receptor Plug Domain